MLREIVRLLPLALVFASSETENSSEAENSDSPFGVSNQLFFSLSLDKKSTGDYATINAALMGIEDKTLFTTIDLSSKELTTIPSAIKEFKNLRTLKLGSNKIREIQNEMFAGFENLVELDLQCNEIKELPVGVFTNLTGLKKLNLYGNQISEVCCGTFNGLPNLTSLELGKNQISKICNGSFNGLSNLRQLLLTENKIVEVETEAFEGLNKLGKIHLNSEGLTLSQKSQLVALLLHLPAVDSVDVKEHEIKTYG